VPFAESVSFSASECRLHEAGCRNRNDVDVHVAIARRKLEDDLAGLDVRIRRRRAVGQRDGALGVRRLLAQNTVALQREEIAPAGDVDAARRGDESEDVVLEICEAVGGDRLAHEHAQQRDHVRHRFVDAAGQPVGDAHFARHELGQDLLL
jgi:hypothetical protein